ncbi:MAG: hypothetical protein LBC44_00530 [Mycoplasmataceae bacterium]|nr:hypothetical protein [Mycoplasmataceae bacterium]
MSEFKMSTWFLGTHKYNKRELVCNWMIISIPIIIFSIEIPLIVIRWEFLIGIFNGTYSPFMWCPMWAGITFSVLVILEVIFAMQKLLLRRNRTKYNNKSSISNSVLRDSFAGKMIDKKYTPIDKQNSTKKEKFE